MQNPWYRAYAIAISVALIVGLCPSFALASNDLSADNNVLQQSSVQLQGQGTAPTQGHETMVASGFWGTCPWELSGDGVLTVYPGIGEQSECGEYNSTSHCWKVVTPWVDYANDIKSVVFKSVQGEKAKAPASCEYLFAGMKNVESIDLSGLDTSNTTDMNRMFATDEEFAGSPVSSTPKLKTIKAETLDTSKVENMNSMFAECVALEQLDLSKWDVSKVTDMELMFGNCESLKALDVSKWKTDSLRDIYGAFSGCSSLKSLNLEAWDTSHITHVASAFRNCSSLTSIGLSTWDTSSVTAFERMFYNCASLNALDLSRWTTSKGYNFSDMFYGCESLSKLDLSGFDTSGVPEEYVSAHMHNMFYRCWSLSEIKLGRKVIQLVDFPAVEVNDHIDWYSNKAGKWFTAKEILSNRLGIEDTYTKSIDLAVAALNLSSVSVVYNGKAHTPEPSVTLNGLTLINGIDFTLSYKDNIEVGTATVIVTGKGNYTGTKSATFKINAAPSTPKTPSTPTVSKVNLSKAAIGGLKAKTYTGKALAQAPVVKVGGITLKSGTDYTVSYANNKNAGTATVTVTGKGNYTGSKSAAFKINKAKQPMTVKAASKAARAKTLKKKAVTLARIITVKKKQGALSYKNASSSKKLKKFKVNAKKGTITIPKGTKKGTYKVKVKVTAKGNANYKPGSKTVTVKITVK